MTSAAAALVIPLLAAAQEPSATTAAPAAPAAVGIPLGEGLKAVPGARWRIRPQVGGTTLRLAGIEHFGDAAVARIAGTRWSPYDATTTSSERRLLTFGMVERLDVSFQMDPLVSVAARVASLRSGRGRLTTTAVGTVGRVTDTWEFSTGMTSVSGGGEFNLPLVPGTTLDVSLFLGVGFAEVLLDHRLRADFTSGGAALEEGSARGGGIAFLPEFAVELDHEFGGAVSAGAALGYRFGGTGFRNRHDTSVNLFGGVPEQETGSDLRRADNAPLDADYGGLVLTAFFAARF